LSDALRDGCIRGEPSSQKKLYQSFYGFAMAICLRYARNRDEAVEIMNDGFLKVLTQLNKYDPEKPFKPWLARVMTNKAIDHYRSQLRYANTEDISEIDDIGKEPCIHNKLNYEDLLILIQCLPNGYRTVFNLYAIDGYTHKEIGNLLGISISTSKTNLLKARQKLRILLEEASSEAKIISMTGSFDK
jgi:RNA polymerase sigma factor (sigma-70 family)